MGAEARIDMQPSGEWLQQVTSSWTWPVSIKVLQAILLHLLLLTWQSST